MHRRDTRRGWEEGAAAVEAAIAFSVLLALVIGIMEFGTALYSWNTMQLAVQQAGRNAMINNATITPSIAEDRMKDVLSSASTCTLTGGNINTPTAGQICVYASTATGTSPNPSTMSLTAVYAYKVIGLSGAFKVTSQATVPLD